MVTHLGNENCPDSAFDVVNKLRRNTITLNVGASTIYKRWPNERWISLGNALLREGFNVALTAGPNEARDAEEIASGLGHRDGLVNLAGKTSQSELALVFKRSLLVISGDTGPLHLAVSVGTRTIALFGPTDPSLTGPYGSGNQVIWKHIDCSPCFRHPTCNGRVDCLRAIDSDEVISVARQMLASAPLAKAIA
jgi:ADP-heptose:LPS heptosyltransferase